MVAVEVVSYALAWFAAAELLLAAAYALRARLGLARAAWRDLAACVGGLAVASAVASVAAADVDLPRAPRAAGPAAALAALAARCAAAGGRWGEAVGGGGARLAWCAWGEP